MAGYTRQSTYADGDIITAADSNNEFNQVLAAFVNTSGHKHDGTAAEGPVIGLIGDPGVATPLNKVVVDDTNNRIGVFVDAGGAGSTVEQLRFQRQEVQQLLSILVNQQLQHIQRVLLQQEQLLLVQVEILPQRLTQ